MVFSLSLDKGDLCDKHTNGCNYVKNWSFWFPVLVLSIAA